MTNHTVKAAAFTRLGGVGTVTLTSIQTAEVNDAGQTTTRGGDGLPEHTLAFYEAGSVTGRIQSSDLSFARTESVAAPGDEIFPGAAGVFVITYGERVQGKGFVGGATDVQATIGGGTDTDGCVIGQVIDRAQHEGESSYSVDFTAISVDGVTRPVAYALATVAQTAVAASAYTVQSASFDPSATSAVLITSLVSAEVRDEASMNTRGSDGLEYHTLAWVESNRVAGQVVTQDLSFKANAGLVPGVAGVMTITFAQKALGIGFVATADVIAVIGAGDRCIIGGPQASAQHEGDPAGTIPFVAVSADGATRAVAYSVA